jgi:homoserine O-succinyltransferase
VTLRLIKPAPAPSEVSDHSSTPPSRLTCAFVNNMPDGAFDATERQFLELLDGASAETEFEVRRYTMEGVPRGEETATRITAEYFSFPEIYHDSPDALIVTGSNPIELDIQDEPYWGDLVDLLTWSRSRVRSTLLSCLSAHAALVVFDGASRQRLSEKCTGVYAQHVEPDRSLTEGLDAEVLLPVSRWNSVADESLEEAGYDIILRSEETGWSAASRVEGGHQTFLIQGHPEYDPSSLLREYRRDAGRYVRGERSEAPPLPYHCVLPDDWEALVRFHHDVVLGARDVQAFEALPVDELGSRAPWPWHSPAVTLFTNWVASVVPERD